MWLSLTNDINYIQNLKFYIKMSNFYLIFNKIIYKINSILKIFYTPSVKGLKIMIFNLIIYTYIFYIIFL